MELARKTEKGIPTANLGPAGTEAIKENQSPVQQRSRSGRNNFPITGSAGESDWKKKRRQVKSLSGYLPWSRKCQVCPSPSTPTKRVCSGSGGQGNEWRPNYSRGKVVVTVSWSGLENRVKQETGSFCSSRPRERLRRCRVHDHLGAACKQATPERGPEKGGVVSSTFSTFLQASWGWKGEV